MNRQMSLALYLRAFGHHYAAWRHAASAASHPYSLDSWARDAQTAERGLFGVIHLADSPAIGNGPWNYLVNPMEPLVLAGAIAARTERIGLVATVSTTFNEPYSVARFLATLDHLSGGRAGWNIVTSQAPDVAANYGLEAMVEHDARYARAEEFVDVVTALCLSWEPEGLVLDRASGVYVDPERVAAIGHRGEHFSVAGPLNIARLPQGRPLYVQSGSSGPGMRLGARVADIVFTSQHDLEQSRRFRQEIGALAAGHGRPAGSIGVMPGIAPILGSTVEEARRRERDLADLMVPEYSIVQLSQFLDYDLSALDLDDPIPVDRLPSNESIGTHRSRNLVVRQAIAKNGGMTVRELVHWHIGGRGHRAFVGTPEQLADELAEWFLAGACDGFNVMPSLNAEDLPLVVDHVIPLLQARGLYPREPRDGTLRQRMGLVDA